jgi:adenylate kinase
MLAEIGKPLDAVLLLEVGDEIASERLEARSVAEGRVDDSPEAIRNRLRLYHELTEPVVDRYRGNGTLVSVHGEGTVEEVAADIEDALSRVGAGSR